MTDRITLLGTKGGPAVRQGGAMPTATLLRLDGRAILVDCGIGATRSLVEAGVSLLDLDAIFVTHLHSDHVLELGPLLYTAWTTGRDRPIAVYGPPGTAAYVENFLRAMAFDHDIRIDDEGRIPIRRLFTLDGIAEGAVASLGGIAVEALRVDHPPVTDCFALRFAWGDRRVVLSADTCFFAPLIDFARGADVLVHEAMLVAGVDRLVARTGHASRLREHLLASHTPAADAGRIAAQAGVGHLVLNHLVPADDPDLGEADWLAETAKTWSGPTTIGRDGLTLDLD